MKNVMFWIGGVCATAAAMIILLGEKDEPVEVLAHKLEVAWADHHTVV